MFRHKIPVLHAFLAMGTMFCVAGWGQGQSYPPAASSETLILDGKAMPLGGGQASDPAVFKLGSQWFMYFSTIGWRQSCAATHSYQYVVQMAAASLPPGASLSASGSVWNIIPAAGGGYAAPIPLGATGAWDENGTETPQVVTGYDPTQGKTVTRLYYSGWRRVPVGTDASGCPIPGYTEMKVGMAEWSSKCNCWNKRPTPVVDGSNMFERMHALLPNGTLTTYSIIGDESVVYIPGPGGGPGLWHMYYQANTDASGVEVITIHATSTDGVNWPAANRKILNTRPPYPTSILPAGPYHLGVSLMNGRLYFVGWIPGSTAANQGLWVVSSSTPDGSAAGDFSDWRPLLYDGDGVWWHDPGPDPTSHQLGLGGPTLVSDGSLLWLYYCGTRQDSSGNWVSVGRAQVDASIIH